MARKRKRRKMTYIREGCRCGGGRCALRTLAAWMEGGGRKSRRRKRKGKSCMIIGYNVHTCLGLISSLTKALFGVDVVFLKAPSGEAFWKSSKSCCEGASLLLVQSAALGALVSLKKLLRTYFGELLAFRAFWKSKSCQKLLQTGPASFHIFLFPP